MWPKHEGNTLKSMTACLLLRHLGLGAEFKNETLNFVFSSNTELMVAKSMTIEFQNINLPAYTNLLFFFSDPLMPPKT